MSMADNGWAPTYVQQKPIKRYKAVFEQDNRLFTRYYADDNSANLGINKQISYGAKLISTHLLDN